MPPCSSGTGSEARGGIGLQIPTPSSPMLQDPLQVSLLCYLQTERPLYSAIVPLAFLLCLAPPGRKNIPSPARAVPHSHLSQSIAFPQYSWSEDHRGHTIPLRLSLRSCSFSHFPFHDFPQSPFLVLYAVTLH